MHFLPAAGWHAFPSGRRLTGISFRPQADMHKFMLKEISLLNSMRAQFEGTAKDPHARGEFIAKTGEVRSRTIPYDLGRYRTARTITYDPVRCRAMSYYLALAAGAASVGGFERVPAGLRESLRV